MNRRAIVFQLSGLLIFSALSICAGQTFDSVGGDIFAFKFQDQQPHIYAYDMLQKSVNTVNNGSLPDVTTRTTRHVQCKFKVQPFKGTAGGGIQVAIQPFDLQVEVNITSPQGRVHVEERDWEVSAKQNGITIIDTAKGIGMGQATGYRNSYLPYFLSGQMTFNRSGAATSFSGDIPFVEYWKMALKIDLGFWNVLFPDQPVPVGKTWSKSYTISAIGSVHLDGEGATNTFTYTRMPDTTISNEPCATFDLVGDNSFANLSGTLEQGGQNSDLNISDCNYSTKGTTHFDPQKGILVDLALTEHGRMSINLLVQTRTVISSMETDTEKHLSLLK